MILKYFEFHQDEGRQSNTNKSLRGGGCGASKKEKQLPQKFLAIGDASLPQSFIPDFENHMIKIVQKASLAYDEGEKEQILISIQWFIAMKEHFNTLCKDSKSAAATYDIIFESLPKLLISSVTYLRISGVLCLQILQIINDLARVIFTFFMTVKDRFLKLEDKECLEELIADFETQLNIEGSNIWVAGAEFEITMIKAVIQSSPSDSEEGKELFKSFIGGLVESGLAMSPSEGLIDSLIGGAKFLYKANKTKNLKKKYEVEYYFQQLKWQLIQLLKQQTQPDSLIKYLIHGYKSYIENSNDWLLNFCWVRVIGSLISYRPIISKEQVSGNLREQARIWNFLIKNKFLNQFSFNKFVGRLQLTQATNVTGEVKKVLDKMGLVFFYQFNEKLLLNFQFSSKKPFALCQINLKDQLKRDYFSLLSLKSPDLDEYTQQLDNIFNQQKENLKKLNSSVKQTQAQNTIFQFKTAIDLCFKSLIQTIAITQTKELQILKNKLIIESIVVKDQNDQHNNCKSDLLKQIEATEQSFELSDYNNLINAHISLIENLVSHETTFEKGNYSEQEKKDVLTFEKQFTDLQNHCKKFFGVEIKLEIKKEQLLMGKEFEFRLNQPLFFLNQTIGKILNMSPLKLKIQKIVQYYTENLNPKNEPQIVSKPEILQYKSQIIYFNTLKYLIQDLIAQLNDQKELLQQINQCIEKNFNTIEVIKVSKKQKLKQDDVIEMLQSQFDMIQQYFSQEALQYMGENSISLDSILSLLRSDQETLNNIKFDDLELQIHSSQTIAFVEQFLLQYQQFPEMLPLVKEQIISIYNDKLGGKKDLKKVQESVIQLEKNQNAPSPIDQIQQRLDQFVGTFSNLIEGFLKVQNVISFQISLSQNIENIQLKLNLKEKCDEKYFKDCQDKVNKQQYELLMQLYEMRLDFINQDSDGDLSIDILNNLLLLIDFTKPRVIAPDEQKGGNFITDFIAENYEAVVEGAKDFLNYDQDYRVKQCFIMCLLQMQTLLEESNLQKFCQDKILYAWGFEKDERVKSILKNPQFLEMQKSLFSADLKSFSSRLKDEMEVRFGKIEELERRIHLEGDQQIRQRLQEDLQLEHDQFEEYLDNINEMDQKLDVGLQFLKDIKKSIAQLKQKIDKLQETVNNIGDDVRKLRGKSFGELIEIRKRKVLDSMQFSSLNQIYIPLKCQEWDPVTGNKKDKLSILLSDKYDNQEGEINEFLQNDSKEKDVLLLRGIAGSGKSRAAIKIEEFLWQKKNERQTDWIPIYVSLPTIKEPKFNLLDQALESEFYQFDKIQTREFKEALQKGGLKIILILDSYDEMKYDCIQSNLYHTNRLAKDFFRNQSDESRIKDHLKVIITTRTEILTSNSYQTWFYGEKLETLKEVELLGFDDDQKQNYLKEYTKLSLQREILELYRFVKTSFEEKFLIDEFLLINQRVWQCKQNNTNQTDFLLNEQQAEKICGILKQEKCFQKIGKAQLVGLQKKLIVLWDVNKFNKLIKSAQIAHILTTPFMMEIVVQVLPSMTAKYSDSSQFKDKFIQNFINISEKEQIKKGLIAKFKFDQEVKQPIDKKELRIQGNKIWDQLQNKNIFSKFSLVDKIDFQDLLQIDSAEIVIRALIVKQLTVFDFYITFVEYYHLQQIKKQQDLGRTFSQESLMIDLFNFSSSLAVDMTLRQLTQIKNIQKGQLKLKFVKSSNDEEDWQDVYFNDFEQNGDYKKLIRSCMLLTQKGSNQSFNHKSIQEFFVGHFLLNLLKQIEIFDQKQLSEIDQADPLILQVLQQKEKKNTQFLLNSVFNQDEFNLSSDNYRGVMYLIKDEMKVQINLKEKLLQTVKLSALSRDYTRASSNCFFLLAFNNESVKYQQLSNIKITDSELTGLNLYESNLEGSEFLNVNINSCNFNNANLKNVKWNGIKCNELHSIISQEELKAMEFAKSGDKLFCFDDRTVYNCNIEQGTLIPLIKENPSDMRLKQIVVSSDGSLIAAYFKGDEILQGHCYTQIQVWDVLKGKPVSQKGNTYPYTKIQFLGDNQYLGLLYASDFSFFSLMNDEQQQDFSNIKDFSYIQGKNILVILNNENILTCFEFLGAQIEEREIGKIKESNFLYLQPDSYNLGLLTNCSLELFNMETKEYIIIYKGESSENIQYSLDGSTLIYQIEKKRIVSFDIIQQKEIKCIEFDDDKKITSLSWDGKLLALYNNMKIVIWEIRVGKIVATFDNFLTPVIQMSFQPGSYILATINAKEVQIKFWDAKTEKTQHNFEGHESSVNKVKFSPDGSMLASCGTDLTVRIWDVKLEKQIYQKKIPNSQRKKVTIDDIDFSNDANYLLIKTTGEKEVNIKLEKPRPVIERILHLYYFHEDKLINMEDLKHNEVLEITSNLSIQASEEIIGWSIRQLNKFKIKLWYLKRNQFEILEEDVKPTNLIFSQDLKYLYSLLSNNILNVWNLEQLKLETFFSGNGKYYFHREIVAFQKGTSFFGYKVQEKIWEKIFELNIDNNEIFVYYTQGSLILACQSEQEKQLWKIEDGQKMGNFKCDDNVQEFSLQGNIFVSYPQSNDIDPVISVFKTESFDKITEFKGHNKQIKIILFSNDALWLLSCSNDDIIILWSLSDFEQKTKIQQKPYEQQQISYCDFAPDSKTFISVLITGTIYLYDIIKGLLKVFHLENRNPMFIYSSNGSLFAYCENLQCYKSNPIIIWDINENKCKIKIGWGYSFFEDFGFIQNDEYLITKYDNNIVLWDVQTGKILEILENTVSDSQIQSVISLDSQIILTYGNDNIVYGWDSKSGKKKCELADKNDHAYRITCVAFSKDGSILATGCHDLNIIIWNTKNWTKRFVLKSHKDEIYFLKFTPISQNLVSGSLDRYVKLWDMKTGEEMQSIFVFQNDVIVFDEDKIAFNQDEKSLYISNLNDDQYRHIYHGFSFPVPLFFSQNELVVCDKYKIYKLDAIRQQINFTFTKKEEINFTFQEKKEIKKYTYNNSQSIIAGIFSDNQFFVLDLKKNEAIYLTSLLIEINQGIEFSPDDQLLVSWCENGIIKLWDFSIYNRQTDGDKKTPLCQKTLGIYQPLRAEQCQITGATITSKIGWDLKQLFIQRGAIEKK